MDDDLDDETVIGVTADVVGTLRKDRAYLIVIAGAQVGEMIPLKATTVLGRGADADVRLLEEKMSRRHCRLVIQNDGTYIEDLRSSNGTYVNGVRVERKQLNDGDKIQVGDTTILKFTYHDSLEESFQRQMYDSALRDGLTKCFNKRYFEDRIRAELAFTTRHRTPLSLILFDLDHFKQVNDTRGHVTGDKVLIAIAQHVERLVRTEDVFARYGGEEFAILCRQTDLEKATVLAERIRGSIAQLSIVVDGAPVAVTASLGVAAVPDRTITDVDQFVGAADEALYEAKRTGRNRVVVRPPA